MKAITCCRMPYQVKPEEAQLYKHLLHCHCQHDDKDGESHECTGAITLSEQAMVLRCKQCGDAKGSYPRETPSHG